MAQISVTTARREFAELINRVAYGHESIIIGRRGKPLAALIPIAALPIVEDWSDTADALRVEADDTDESIPWEDVKRDLPK